MLASVWQKVTDFHHCPPGALQLLCSLGLPLPLSLRLLGLLRLCGRVWLCGLLLAEAAGPLIAIKGCRLVLVAETVGLAWVAGTLVAKAAPDVAVRPKWFHTFHRLKELRGQRGVAVAEASRTLFTINKRIHDCVFFGAKNEFTKKLHADCDESRCIKI